MTREWELRLSRSTFSFGVEFICSSVVEGFFATMTEVKETRIAGKHGGHGAIPFHR